MSELRPVEPDRYKASSLRAYNVKLVERYDTALAVRMLRLSTMDEFVLDALGQSVRDSSILDVGCATGRLLERLGGAGARRLAGSDLAPRILEVAGRRLARAGLEADLRSADAETLLPWGPQTFDVVTLTGVLHHFSSPSSALGEIRRVLREDGTFVVVDPCFFPAMRELLNLCLRVHPHEGDYRFYTSREARELLEALGWRVTRCERLNWWAFGAVSR